MLMIIFEKIKRKENNAIHTLSKSCVQVILDGENEMAQIRPFICDIFERVVVFVSTFRPKDYDFL